MVSKRSHSHNGPLSFYVQLLLGGNFFPGISFVLRILEVAPIKCAVRESAVIMTFSQESVIRARNSQNFKLLCMRKCRSNIRFSNGTFYRSNL